tara:strand:- start:42980 stop:43900 length:921 start_codon:yes stop_codon:yes gene_type:complete
MQMKFARLISFFTLCLFFMLESCSENKTIDVQGHRGCRGLLPENSVPAMKKALELGVTTLEMDASITKDKKVVLSHDPFLSNEFCSYPDGTPVTEDEEKELAIYQMTFDSLSLYDCGQRKNPRFPEQQTMPVTKPLLSTIISTSEASANQLNRPAPFYNIETKSTLEGDDSYHPAPKEFVDLLMNVVLEANIKERVIIQSFDVRTLQVMHQDYPKIKLALLVENEYSIEENIDLLGFQPDIYSCDYTLINDQVLSYCKAHHIELIPWTVNEKEDMVRLLEMGVDGIITDYPNRLNEVLKSRKELVK